MDIRYTALQWQKEASDMLFNLHVFAHLFNNQIHSVATPTDRVITDAKHALV